MDIQNYFAYKPFYTAKYGDDANYWERAYNLYLRSILIPEINKISEEIFGEDCPPVEYLEGKAQVVLVSTHPAIAYAEPLPPNVIPVGGIQVTDPNPLDDEVDEFINKGQNGSILFSLGTKDLEPFTLNAIVEVFRQLPQYNFLWKFEDDSVPLHLSPNVLARKWFRQSDILNHQNIKGFVTHGGSLGMYEASWYGVPTIGIPFFANQRSNVYRSVLAGVSEYINYSTLTTDELRSKLLKILTDPGYAERAALRSRRLREQPDKPIDRAIWWIENVIRNPDLSHPGSPNDKLAAIAANSLDLYRIISCVSFMLMLLMIYVFIVCVIKVNSVKHTYAPI